MSRQVSHFRCPADSRAGYSRLVRIGKVPVAQAAAKVVRDERQCDRTLGRLSTHKAALPRAKAAFYASIGVRDRRPFGVSVFEGGIV